MPIISKKKHQKRFAYIKNGDVIDELETLPDFPKSYILGNGGPYHYLGSFREWTEGSEILLISLDIQNKLLRLHNGLAAQVINTKKYPNFGWKLLLQFNATVQIIKNLLSFKPTWLLCAISSGMPLAACFLTARISGIPFVCTRHMRIDHFKPSFLLKLRGMFDNWMIRKADAVLCNGPYLEDQLRKIGVQKERIVQFGLPYTNIGNGPDFTSERLKAPQNDCRILYAGRIEEKKGAVDLLNACRPLLQDSDAASLTYIGHGQALNKLICKTKKFGLEKKVFFLGQLQHSATIQMMKQYDVLVVPTQQRLGEGRCKTIIEGLIVGVPVIAPNYGAFRYLVKDGVNGLFYKPDSVDDLSLKISYLIDNADFRAQLAKNAKKMGHDLREPSKTFMQALQIAFNRTRRHIQ